MVGRCVCGGAELLNPSAYYIGMGKKHPPITYWKWRSSEGHLHPFLLSRPSPPHPPNRPSRNSPFLFNISHVPVNHKPVVAAQTYLVRIWTVFLQKKKVKGKGEFDSKSNA